MNLKGEKVGGVSSSSFFLGSFSSGVAAVVIFVVWMEWGGALLLLQLFLYSPVCLFLEEMEEVEGGGLWRRNACLQKADDDDGGARFKWRSLAAADPCNHRDRYTHTHTHTNNNYEEPPERPWPPLAALAKAKHHTHLGD